MSKILTLLLVAFLSSCTRFDDYMLGKDNTPVPKTLKELHSKVTLTKKWSVSLGKSSKNSVYLKLKPLMQGNKIYVADTAGHFEALNAHTGNVIWSKSTNYKFISGPTLGGGVLVLATNNSQLIAFSANDGHQIWRKKLSGDVLATPVIADNQVIAKTINGNLYSVGVVDGKQHWFLEHGAPSLVLKASSSPVLMNNQTLLVGYSDGKLEAITLKTGQVLWQRSIIYATGSSDVERLIDIDADPIVAGNTVFLGSYQGSVGAISLDDGQFIWRRPASIYKNMMLQNNVIYYTDSSDVVWAIDKRNGQVNWKQPALKARNLTEPLVQGNRLYIGDKTGIIHVLDASTGELIGRVPMKGAVYVPPIISGNRLYVFTATNELSCYLVS